MATDRLSLYNGALRECGERRLASLSENREPRRVLDDIWTGGTGIVKFVLQAKQWRFGRRLVELTPEPSIEPAFGRMNAYAVPDDWARTCKLCQDERMDVPLLDYEVEAGYWYADLNPIYLSYISTDANYGGDLTLWPPNVVLWAETHMASLLSPRLMGSEEKTNRLIKLASMRLKEAASTDAMEDPTKFPPLGSFVMARRGGRSTWERGPRNRLIG